MKNGRKPMRDLSGLRFGRWSVIRFSHCVKTAYFWECLCDCGIKKLVRGNGLTKGTSKSCGCLNRELISKRDSERNTTHGLSHIPEYKIWKDMIKRCENKKSKSYHNYGGRGISVCSEWRNSFEEFYKNIGVRPSKNHQIDRINNNGNYEPGNIRWVTRKENCRNTRKNHYLTFNGKTQSIASWADELRVDYGTIKRRVNKFKWSDSKALSTPFL